MPALEPRYAEALLSVAKNEREASEIGTALKGFSDMMREYGELKWFLLNPVIAAESKKEMVKKLLPENTPESAVKFLCLLIDKARLVNLSGIIDVYIRKKAEQDNTLVIEVTSSEPLDERQIEEISNLYLKKTSAKRARVKTMTDASLMGGLRVKIGDTLIDDTLAGRLGRLKSAINVIGK